MNNIINIEKYIIQKRKDEETEKIKKRRDMVLAMDTLIQEAYRKGLCPTCGGLAGRHGTYCEENPKHPYKNHEKRNKYNNSKLSLCRAKKM